MQSCESVPQSAGLVIDFVSANETWSDGLEGMLDEQERARASRFRHHHSRVSYVAGHAALRRHLGRRLGIPPDRVIYGRADCPTCGEPHGRPTVVTAEGAEPLNFSLSRSGDIALIASAHWDVGVDVEAVPEPERADEIAVILHYAEQEELARVPEADRGRAFAAVWTRKEAYLKALGTGLGRRPDADYTGADPTRRPAGWVFIDPGLPSDYVGAVAVKPPCL